MRERYRIASTCRLWSSSRDQAFGKQNSATDSDGWTHGHGPRARIGEASVRGVVKREDLWAGMFDMKANCALIVEVLRVIVS